MPSQKAYLTVIRSDTGPGFNNIHYTEFLDAYGIKGVKSSAYYPQSNQQVERGVQKHLIKRRAEQVRLSRKRGHHNRDTFKIGDPVVIQDLQTRTWKRKGTVLEKRIAPDLTSHSYYVEDAHRTRFLRNGCYLHHT